MSLAKFVSGHETSDRDLRAFRRIAPGAVAAVLAKAGSLKAMQTASIADDVSAFAGHRGTLRSLHQLGLNGQPLTTSGRDAVVAGTHVVSSLLGNE